MESTSNKNTPRIVNQAPAANYNPWNLLFRPRNRTESETSTNSNLAATPQNYQPGTVVSEEDKACITCSSVQGFPNVPENHCNVWYSIWRLAEADQEIKRGISVDDVAFLAARTPTAWETLRPKTQHESF